MIQDTPARPPLIGSKKNPLCGLKSERKQVVCAQKNLPRVKKSRPKSKSFFVYLIQSVNYSTVYLV